MEDCKHENVTLYDPEGHRCVRCFQPFYPDVLVGTGIIFDEASDIPEEVWKTPLGTKRTDNLPLGVKPK